MLTGSLLLCMFVLCECTALIGWERVCTALRGWERVYYLSPGFGVTGTGELPSGC